MTDSSLKSLSTFTFACVGRKSPRSHQRHITKVFATICWFNELRLVIEAKTTAAVQRAIEPMAEGTREQLEGRGRRWRGYRDGRYYPSKPVVALAENHCPGSEWILTSPFWNTLRLDLPDRRVAEALLGTTNTLGDELLERMLALGRRPEEIPCSWLSKRCGALLRIRRLEVLGILVACLRLASRAGHGMVTEYFLWEVEDALLIFGGWFYDHGVAQGLADYFEDILLPSCLGGTRLKALSSEDFLSSLAEVHRALGRRMEENGGTLPNHEALRILTRLAKSGTRARIRRKAIREICA